MNGSYERRESLRLDMEKQIVSIHWNSPNGDRLTRDVMCVDVSNGGFQLELDFPIPTDTLVSILFQPHLPESQSYQGKVLRTILQEHGWYNVALKFLDKE